MNSLFRRPVFTLRDNYILIEYCQIVHTYIQHKHTVGLVSTIVCNPTILTEKAFYHKFAFGLMQIKYTEMAHMFKTSGELNMVLQPNYEIG